MADHRRYVAVETAISLVINAAISAGITWFVFGGRSEIPLAGSGGVLIDFIPQTFMIALMSVIVPTLLTRSRVRSKKLAPGPTGSAGFALPRNVLLRALLIAVVATLVLGGVAALLLKVFHPGDFDFLPLLLFKILYGVFVALIVTPFAVSRALGDSTV